jgi:hypothetical protein
MNRRILLAALLTATTVASAQAPAKKSDPIVVKSTPAATPAAVATPAPPSPAQLEKAQRLVTALKGDAAADQLAGQIKDRIHTLGQQQSAQATTDEQKKIATAYVGKLDNLTNEALDISKIHSQIVQIYATSYTGAELDSAIAFYASPLGQSFLTKSQASTTQTNQIFESILRELQPKLGQATRTFQTDIKATQPPTISTPESMQPTAPSATKPTPTLPVK